MLNVQVTSRVKELGTKKYTSVDPKQMQKKSIILYMRTKEPRVGDKCGRQVWETSGRQV